MSEKKQILVVEDDQYIRDSLTELLNDEGYSVTVARDGQEGLETLQGQSLPDLILLDLMMPVKDGFQFRTEQQQDPRISDIPVIIFSADTGVNQPCSQFEGVAILKKPVDLDALLAMVKQHCL